jgi:hypothetical protein
VREYEEALDELEKEKAREVAAARSEARRDAETQHEQVAHGGPRP